MMDFLIQIMPNVIDRFDVFLESIYETFLMKFGLKPEECVFLDDSPANIAAAEELGIRGVRFTTREAVMEELKRLGVE